MSVAVFDSRALAAPLNYFERSPHMMGFFVKIPNFGPLFRKQRRQR